MYDFDNFSDEMKLTIFGFLPHQKKIEFQSVSKHWLQLLRDKSFWRETGANDYSDFVKRINLLSKELQELVLNKTYSLKFAEQIKQLCELSLLDRQSKFISDEQAVLMPTVFYLDALLSVPYGVMALKENLITPEQAAQMRCSEYISTLLCRYGVESLRKNLITPEDIHNIKTARLCEVLLCKYGVQALREKLISVEQINAFTNPRSLKRLLTKEGLNAMREGLITPEDATKILPGHLKCLLMDGRIEALKLKLITFEEIKKLESASMLDGYIMRALEVHSRNENQLTNKL